MKKINKAEITRFSREETQQRTRQRLIESAYLLVAEKGVEGTSINDIAKGAGYTKGAFHSNFESKEDLILNLLDQHNDQIAQSLLSVVKKASTDFDSALAAVSSWIQDYAMDRHLALLSTELYLFAARNAAFEKEYTVMMDRHRHTYADLLSYLFNLAHIRLPESPLKLANSLITLVRSSAVDKALYGKVTDDNAIALFINLLRGYKPTRDA
ncbi:TetR/AcrR family transcriptional regulator [Snodgrassella sp. CFCC 13594]|uniref:TetR/AcrR family transcriptional regulator n=1 Tax=Snodgrassella sp. CFCC 13594 TaxID=1775559 RepID=UPI00083008CF|nr:TetR/AcrR family transcriptional regulator [Snodgrassella sp. CFCC 13594]